LIIPATLMARRSASAVLVSALPTVSVWPMIEASTPGRWAELSTIFGSRAADSAVSWMPPDSK
jgi:hypothetical protein